MEPNKILQIGSKYSKTDLSTLLDQPSLTSVREGVYTCKNSPCYLLFVDLEKAGKETRFHFNDFFEEDYQRAAERAENRAADDFIIAAGRLVKMG